MWKWKLGGVAALTANLNSFGMNYGLARIRLRVLVVIPFIYEHEYSFICVGIFIHLILIQFVHKLVEIFVIKIGQYSSQALVNLIMD